MNQFALVEADDISVVSTETSGSHWRQLSQITLQIRAGETVALLGPTGAGKRTLLALLNGSIQPSTGRLTLHAPVVHLGVGERLEKLALQPPALLLLNGPLDTYQPSAAGTIVPFLRTWSDQGGATLIATQYLALAADTAERTIVLEQGRVIADIRTADLLRRLRIEMYSIRVRGHLPPEWADFIDGFTLTHLPRGESLLVGPIPDQAALQGVIATIRALGLELCDIIRIDQPIEAILDQLRRMEPE
jgi:ABC-type multidrug transport system ATPase subunit